MQRIRNFLQIFLRVIFLTSFRKSINNQFPTKNTEGIINKNTFIEKKQKQVKFAFEIDRILVNFYYCWIIMKEHIQEKVCTWKSVPLTKDCDMEKDKLNKLKNLEIWEDKIFLLEKQI